VRAEHRHEQTIAHDARHFVGMFAHPIVGATRQYRLIVEGGQSADAPKHSRDTGAVVLIAIGNRERVFAKAEFDLAVNDVSF
jgi:hypothetical protein